MNNVKIIAEIGINHNGNLEEAKKLIDIAVIAGCDFVKFQKRDPELCVPENMKNKEKIVPWRESPTTYLQYKKDIEFGKKEYLEIFKYCVKKGIGVFASIWDNPSALFMREFTDICKIPSAKVTDLGLLVECRDLFDFRIISTGMSTEKEIEEAVRLFDPQVIMHTNSQYPTPINECNLGYIEWLRKKYPNKEIGYSNHYYGIVPLMASVYLGVKWVEFHITLNHENWGSDQNSSVEPSGVFKLVKGIRDLEKAYKGNHPREVYPGELEKLKSLRG